MARQRLNVIERVVREPTLETVSEEVERDLRKLVALCEYLGWQNVSSALRTAMDELSKVSVRHH